MRRLTCAFIVLSLFFNNLTFLTPSPVYSQENPEDPNGIYPIEGPQNEEDIVPQSYPDSPVYTYPIEGTEPFLLPLQNQFEYNAPLPSPELVEVYPNEELFEPIPPEMPFQFDTEPAIYIEGNPIILRIVVSQDQLLQLTGKELKLELPDGLVPIDEQLFSLLSPEGVLSIPLDHLSSEIAFKETKPLSELSSEIVFSASIFENGIAIYTKLLSLPTQGFFLNDLPSLQATNYSVTLQSEDENISSDLFFYVGSLRSQSIPSHSLSLNPVEILAVDPITGKNVNTFEQPLQISLGYSDGDFTPEEERNLQAFYYSDLYQDWFPIQTQTDPDLNKVHFQTDHLTVFDIKVENWQSYIPPITQSYEVSGFTGAMAYNYPLQTFAGPGGLKPDLTLRYNSQVIDQSIAYTQASWVGMGWSLETGSITRDMHGTDDNTNDDTFYLTYNGMSQRLLPISKTNDLIDYRSQENPTEKVTWNTSSNIWEVRSGDGLIYTFGGPNAVAKLKQGEGCAITEAELNLTWQWGLSSVRDRFGNTINYTYVPEQKGARVGKNNNGVNCVNHISLIPQKISYGNFTVQFVTAPRYDYRSSWEDHLSKVLFTRKRLDHVDLLVGGTVVKSYLFRYASDDETNNVIYPNFKWFQGYGKTSTLIKIQEVQSSGHSPVEGYKPITFSYAIDHMHLDEVNNGYGGRLQIAYEPKYQDDDVNHDVRTARWCFGYKNCPSTTPNAIYCYHPFVYDDWSGHNTEVHCSPTYDESPYDPAQSEIERNLKISHNGSYSSIAFHSFPEAMIKPGGRYIFYGKAKSIDFGTNTKFGFTTGIPPTEATNPISVPEDFINTPVPDQSPWLHGQYPLVMPADYNFDDVKLYLENDGLLIKDLQVQQFITRYVVTQRIETDTITGKSASWTYQYPAEGFKMNTGIGDNPYVKTKLEYRGFSSVTITQKESNRQDSLITIQEFHQDDLLKGRLKSEVTKGSDGLCYSKSSYEYESSKLLDHSHLPGLGNFTDLDINWIRTKSVEKLSFDGANCDSLSTSDHLGTRQVYAYPAPTDYWASLNGEPLSITQKVFNGVSWVNEFATWNEYEPSTDLVLGGKTFFLSRIPKASRVKACPSDGCTGDLQAETLYFYNANKTLNSQKKWAKGSGAAREYSQTNYSYHPNGSVATNTVWQGFSTESGDPTGNSRTTQFTYDAVFPTLVTQENVIANGTTYTTSTAYDHRFGLPIQVTHPNGAIESAVYDGLGRTIRICAPGDATDYYACSSGTVFTLNIHYNLDASPPQIMVKRRGMASVLFKYTGFGNPRSKTILDALINDNKTNWVEKYYEYDGFGRVIIESTGGLSVRTTYDFLGRVLTTGRIEGSTVQAVATYHYAFEAYGTNEKVLKTSVTDANGNTSYTYTNAKGLTVKTSPPVSSGPSVQFSYDLLGRLTQSMYGDYATNITYNPAGQKIQMADPDMGTWTYSYDALGNLTSQTDARGQITFISYDGLNRLTGKTFSNGDPAITYTYDENGQLGYRTSMTDASGEAHWTYDQRGRMSIENKIIKGQLFTTHWRYDSQNRVVGMTYPDGEVLYYSYLPQGGIKAVNSNRTRLLTNTLVDEHGRMKQRMYADKNGETDTPYNKNYYYHGWYEDAGRPGRMSVKRTTVEENTISYIDMAIQYDAVGNITEIHDYKNNNENNEYQVQTFEYDALNRLVRAVSNSIGVGTYSNQSYQYNVETGNLQQKSDVGAYNYQQDKPHAVEQAGTYQYQYDANGNMTQRSLNNGQTVYEYIYNAENRIVEIKKDGVITRRFAYDGDGKRVYEMVFEGFEADKPEETFYVGTYYEQKIAGKRVAVDLPDVVTDTYMSYFPIIHQEREKESVSYYYADGERFAMKSGGNTYYLFSDHLVSTTTIVERGSGAKIDYQLYHPWGTTRYSTQSYREQMTDYGYTGQMQVDDIYYYNARWYDPVIGRFMQADTLVPSHQGTQGFDRYAYVNNNPMRYIDPTGHQIIEGWNEDYLQRQEGNTCGVVALAMGLSVLYNEKITQSDIQFLFPQTYPSKKFPDGLGAPPMQIEITTNAGFGMGVKATYTHKATLEQLKQNIFENKPTLVLFQLPEFESIGHYLLVIGYSEEEGFIFADPHGKKLEESAFLARYDEERRYNSFGEIWSVDYWPLLRPNTMITLEYNTNTLYGSLLQFINYQPRNWNRSNYSNREELR